MFSRTHVTILAALITAGATVLAALVTADSSKKGLDSISNLFCPSTINALDNSRVTEGDLKTRLEAKNLEIISLRNELSNLTIQLERAKSTSKQTSQQIIQGQSRLSTPSQSIQSGEFRVSPGIPQALLKGEVILEPLKIYQGINPRINYVAFALDYKSTNIPDRNGLRVSSSQSVDFMHRGIKYRILAGTIVPEDNTASLILRAIN